MDNTSLECMSHWLSKDKVKFQVDVWVWEKFAKM